MKKPRKTRPKPILLPLVPRVLQTRTLREETLRRRLQKQTEKIENNKEKLDTKELLTAATSLMQSIQNNTSSSGDHVEITKMKHTVEDLGDTVNDLKDSVGNLSQSVQHITSTLTVVAEIYAAASRQTSGQVVSRNGEPTGKKHATTVCARRHSR